MPQHFSREKASTSDKLLLQLLAMHARALAPGTARLVPGLRRRRVFCQLRVGNHIFSCIERARCPGKAQLSTERSSLLVCGAGADSGQNSNDDGDTPTAEEKAALQQRLADQRLYSSQDPEGIGAEYGQVCIMPICCIDCAHIACAPNIGYTGDAQ